MRHVQPSHRQPDLFERNNPPVALTVAELRTLMPLVSMLLTETILSTPAMGMGMGMGNEDHA